MPSPPSPGICVAFISDKPLTIHWLHSLRTCRRASTGSTESMGEAGLMEGAAEQQEAVTTDGKGEGDDAADDQPETTSEAVNVKVEASEGLTQSR